MNNIVICGRITKDLELKTAKSGMEMMTFSVAVDRRKKDADGNKASDFFEVVAFGKTAAFVNAYFHKGDGITVQGRMESDKWEDKDGNKRISWRIMADNIEFALGKGRGESGSVGIPTMTEVQDEANLPF